MGEKTEVPENIEKMSINVNIRSPVFIGGVAILLICLIFMLVYVFSDDEETSKGILIIGTPAPDPDPGPELNQVTGPRLEQIQTDDKQCTTVSDCVGKNKAQEIYTKSGLSISNEELDCLNTEEPYCLLNTCIYPYKYVGERCGTGKECNSNLECTTITSVDTTNCEGDAEIFIPFHEWVNIITESPGQYSAGDSISGVFNRQIDLIAGYELEHYGQDITNLEQLRTDSDEVKHGQIALARYMLKDIKGISNTEISTTITGGWDGYNDLLDSSEIGFNDDSTTITKIAVDYCSEVPIKNNVRDSLPLYDLVSSRFNSEQLDYIDEMYQCNNKIIDVYDSSRATTCTDGEDLTEGITCQYDSENDYCIPTTETPNFEQTEISGDSLQSFDHCKAYYSRDGYDCIRDDNNFYSFGGLFSICKNADRCA